MAIFCTGVKMDRKTTDYLHVNLTFYLPVKGKEKVKVSSDTNLSSANIPAVEAPIMRARHKQYLLTDKQKEDLQAVCNQIYDVVDEIMREAE